MMTDKDVYTRKIDKYLRITMPLKLVEDIKGGYLMLGDDKTLRIINKNQLQELGENIKQESDKNKKMALSFILNNIIPLAMDKRNRFKLPLIYKEYIGANKAIDIVQTDGDIKIFANKDS